MSDEKRIIGRKVVSKPGAALVVTELELRDDAAEAARLRARVKVLEEALRDAAAGLDRAAETIHGEFCGGGHHNDVCAEIDPFIERASRALGSSASPSVKGEP